MNREIRLWKLHRRLMEKNRQSLKKPLPTICNGCKEEFEPKALFSYIDENNAVITQNAKPYCEKCYIRIYGGLDA